jgi:hypothetical protein
MGWKKKWHGEINMGESRVGDKNNGEENRNEVHHYL